MFGDKDQKPTDIPPMMKEFFCRNYDKLESISILKNKNTNLCLFLNLFEELAE